METKTIRIAYNIWENDISLFSDNDKKLIQLSTDFCKTAYAPYSQFHVGVSIQTNDNKFIGGNNQENAAYPSGLCAERVAVFYTNANFPNSTIETICISAYYQGSLTNTPVTPCGSCRQVLYESEQRQKKEIRFLLVGKNQIFEILGVASFLPLVFGKNMLEIM